VITESVIIPSVAVSYVSNALNTFPKEPVSQSVYVRIQPASMKIDSDTARYAGAAIICLTWSWNLALRWPGPLVQAFVPYQEELPSRTGADIKELAVPPISHTRIFRAR
jgi:hypothetical protein